MIKACSVVALALLLLPTGAQAYGDNEAEHNYYDSRGRQEAAERNRDYSREGSEEHGYWQNESQNRQRDADLWDAERERQNRERRDRDGGSRY